jgi:hypothetical protein
MLPVATVVCAIVVVRAKSSTNAKTAHRETRGLVIGRGDKMFRNMNYLPGL